MTKHLNSWKRNSWSWILLCVFVKNLLSYCVKCCSLLALMIIASSLPVNKKKSLAAVVEESFGLLRKTFCLKLQFYNLPHGYWYSFIQNPARLCLLSMLGAFEAHWWITVLVQLLLYTISDWLRWKRMWNSRRSLKWPEQFLEVRPVTTLRKVETFQHSIIIRLETQQHSWFTIIVANAAFSVVEKHFVNFLLANILEVDVLRWTIFFVAPRSILEPTGLW